MDREDELTDHDGMLQSARRLYLQLQGVLNRRAESLAMDRALCDDTRDEKRAKALIDEIRALQSALETCSRYEARIEAEIADRRGRGAGEMDLDAARREVLGALARLAERG